MIESGGEEEMSAACGSTTDPARQPPEAMGQLDGQDQLFKLAEGYYVTKALLAVWRLGLLDEAVAGADVDVGSVARERALDGDMLSPLLDYLVVRGYLELVRPRVYRLSSRGVASVPFYGYLSTLIGAYEPVFARIEELVGGKVLYGRDIVRSHEEMARGLTALEDRLMGAVIDMVGDTVGTVLDLGCGSARMLARIVQQSDGIRGIGVDRDPNSCAVARETVRRENLEDRITIVQGDAGDVASLPPGLREDVDTVTVMFLLHEILGQRGRASTVALLSEIAALVGPGGRLVMVEVSGAAEPVYQADLSFVPEYELIHNYTNQRLAPRPEWEAMVDEAGMKVECIAPVNMCQSFCLVATPACGSGGQGGSCEISGGGR